jgi:hypothetical protein
VSSRTVRPIVMLRTTGKVAAVSPPPEPNKLRKIIAGVVLTGC